MAVAKVNRNKKHVAPLALGLKRTNQCRDISKFEQTQTTT